MMRMADVDGSGSGVVPPKAMSPALNNCKMPPVDTNSYQQTPKVYK
jgi:hypothetical protein